MGEYKYEVAFSFLKDDESLALKINDLIQERTSTFIYSKKQEELAGNNGEEVFNRVFGVEARIVVVLYRANWGKTPWTRIEETAIRNRGYEEGYDFTIFIPLDEPASVPNWLPKTQIWANITRWGIDGAANIIETKIQQAGGQTREESLEERATRLKRNIDFNKEKKQFLNSEFGVKEAHNEFGKILHFMTLRGKEISEETGLEFNIKQGAERTRWVEIYSKFHCVSIDWYYLYASSLKDSRLSVELWEGGRHREGRYYSRHSSPRKLLGKEFNFDRNELGEYLWTKESQSFYSKQLVEYCIKLLIDNLHKKEISI